MTLAQAMLLGILIIASLEDMEEMSLPNVVPGYASVIGVLSLVAGIGVQPLDGFLGTAVGLGAMILVATMPIWVYWLFVAFGFGPTFRVLFGHPPITLGGADIKMMAAIGLFLGWKLTLVAIFFSYLAGALVGVFGLVAKSLNRKAHVPFVPAITMGTWLAMMFGQQWISIYQHLVFS